MFWLVRGLLGLVGMLCLEKNFIMIKNFDSWVIKYVLFFYINYVLVFFLRVKEMIVVYRNFF